MGYIRYRYKFLFRGRGEDLGSLGLAGYMRRSVPKMKRDTASLKGGPRRITLCSNLVCQGQEEDTRPRPQTETHSKS